MTENKITVAMEKYGRQIPTVNVALLREKMQNAEDNCMDELMNLPVKSRWIAFWLSFFLGGIGAGRFYLGDTKIGVAHIVVTVLAGALAFVPILGVIASIVSSIRAIAELFLCFNKAKNDNYKLLSEYLLAHRKVNANEKKVEE